MDEIVFDPDSWLEDPLLEVPAADRAGLGELDRLELLQCLIDALGTDVVSIRLPKVTRSGAPSSSAGLLVPGSRIHVSLQSMSKNFFLNLVNLSVLVGTGVLNGHGQVLGTVGGFAAQSAVQALSRLSEAELSLVRYVAHRNREGSFVTREEIISAFGEPSGGVLSRLESSGVLRSDENGTQVVF